ncbi:MAG: metalloregulator ArsR/SmtB family transcription factor [Pseudomonadota bacterium]
MVKSEHLDSTFGALADPTRRLMVARLLKGDATVSELAEPHDMSMPAVLKHVNKLVDAGLVDRRKEGRVVTCSLRAEALQNANTWLETQLEAWTHRFDALDAYLARQKEENG